MAKTQVSDWNYDLIYNIRAVSRASVEIQRHHHLTPYIKNALRNLDRRLLLKDSRRHQNRDPHHEWSPQPPPERTTRWVTSLPTRVPIPGTRKGKPAKRIPPSSTSIIHSRFAKVSRSSLAACSSDKGLLESHGYVGPRREPRHWEREPTTPHKGR
jgi:hypothetical protein